MLEKLWLTYYNDALYANGLIIEEERNKMRIRIKNKSIFHGTINHIAGDSEKDSLPPAIFVTRETLPKEMITLFLQVVFIIQ